MGAERSEQPFWRRVLDFVTRRQRREPVIDTRVTADDIRRAKELMAKHREFLEGKR